MHVCNFKDVLAVFLVHTVVATACWTRNGLLVCHNDADCEENAKCHEGRVCTCRVARGVCECLLPEEVEAARAEEAASSERSEAEVEVDRAFQIADKDQDGRISLEEAIAARAGNMKEAEGHQLTQDEDEEEFRILDENKDGFISRAELSRAFEAGEDERDEEGAAWKEAEQDQDL
mmetsp:Transcript_53983/g.101380  ORF Transcript_53983/g.101380 Transcript_53983/m.101380 type:complete len:176 (+) Transcript_53983:45-572(+)